MVSGNKGVDWEWDTFWACMQASCTKILQSDSGLLILEIRTHIDLKEDIIINQVVIEKYPGPFILILVKTCREGDQDKFSVKGIEKRHVTPHKQNICHEMLAVVSMSLRFQSFCSPPRPKSPDYEFQIHGRIQVDDI